MAAIGENLKINSERLWDSLMEMAKVGPGVAGGNNRQTLTDEDSEGRQCFSIGARLLAARWALIKWAICLRVAREQTLRPCQFMWGPI